MEKVSGNVIAARLGIPRQAVYRLAERGIIPGTALPAQPWNAGEYRRWLFDETAVVEAYERYLEGRLSAVAG